MPTVAIWYSYKAIKHPVPDRVNFWHPGTLTLSPERQSAQMSEITDDCLTLSGTGCFIAVPTHIKQLHGCQGVKIHWNIGLIQAWSTCESAVGITRHSKPTLFIAPHLTQQMRCRDVVFTTPHTHVWHRLLIFHQIQQTSKQLIVHAVRTWLKTDSWQFTKLQILLILHIGHYNLFCSVPELFPQCSETFDRMIRSICIKNHHSRNNPKNFLLGDFEPILVIPKKVSKWTNL